MFGLFQDNRHRASLDRVALANKKHAEKSQAVYTPGPRQAIPEANPHFDAVQRAAGRTNATGTREQALAYLRSIADERERYDEWDAIWKEARV